MNALTPESLRSAFRDQPFNTPRSARGQVRPHRGVDHLRVGRREGAGAAGYPSKGRLADGLGGRVTAHRSMPSSGALPRHIAVGQP